MRWSPKPRTSWSLTWRDKPPAVGGERLPDWGSYTFQYKGQEIRGRQVVLINAFCSAPPPDATTRMVIVFDGGPCYFKAHWDPVDKMYTRVVFHGHA